MSARLFQFYPSPLCAKIRKILEFKGIAYDVAEVDYLDRRELLAASGQIKVPALMLEGGEVAVDSDWIVARLEALMPYPAILPPIGRGLHLTLARYFDTGLSEVMLRAAMGDLLEYYRGKSEQHLAFFKLIHDSRHGADFCERTASDREANLQQAAELLSPLDEALSGKAFLLGRLGLADFALYGQLWRLAFTGELKIPESMPNLREFFGRIDRLSASIDQR